MNFAKKTVNRVINPRNTQAYSNGRAYFTLRNETKRNGTLRNGTLRNGALRNGTLRNGTLRNIGHERQRR